MKTETLVVFFDTPDPSTSRTREIRDIVEFNIDPRGNIKYFVHGYANGTEVEIDFYNANRTVVGEVEAALYRAGYDVEYA